LLHDWLGETVLKKGTLQAYATTCQLLDILIFSEDLQRNASIATKRAAE
jgi:hypothetical protein